MTEGSIVDLWDQLEVGMEVEHNGDGGSSRSRFQKGTIISKTVDQIRMMIPGVGEWYCRNVPGITIRFISKIKLSSSKYLLVHPTTERIVAYATDKEHLSEVFSKMKELVNIYEIKPIKTTVKIEGF